MADSRDANNGPATINRAAAARPDMRLALITNLPGNGIRITLRARIATSGAAATDSVPAGERSSERGASPGNIQPLFTLTNDQFK